MKKRIDLKLKEEEGDDINPRHCPKVATRLLHHIKTIPVWSCICRDHFGYGRVPASSAPVESEFKNIKQLIMTEKERLDEAVKKLISYYKGKLKLINCKKEETERKCPEVETSINSSLPEKSPSKDLNFIEDDKMLRNSINSSLFDKSTSKDLNFIEDNTIFTSSPEVFPQRTPLKDLSSEINIMDEVISTSCIACKNGDFPSGSHTCIVCQANVHVLEGCSITVDEQEEGHGQKRLCIACSQSSKRKMKIALNEIENWGNLGQPKKKVRRALYLNHTNRDLDDILYSSNCRTIPIIKNGDSESLKFVTLEKEMISLTNTCSLDSLFQILLAGVTDRENILQYLHQERYSDDLFDMVLNVSGKKIETSTYKKRASIFLEYFKKNLDPNLIEAVDCACNIISLANFLFKSTPSFKEKAVCEAGCQPRIKSLPTITITQKELYQPLENVIKNHLLLPPMKCRQKKCIKMETNEILSVGKY